MKKIGILGGLAWPATVEYYRAICRMSQDYHGDKGLPGPSPMPEMCIESVNINYSYNRRGTIGDEDSWKAYDAYFNRALKRLEDNGVDFAIMASNTPHNRYDAVTRGIRIPMLSIFDVVAGVCRERKMDRFLLLGTEPTMESGVFPRQLKKQGIHAFVPPEGERQKAVAGLISELFKGPVPDGASRIEEIVHASYAETDSGEPVSSGKKIVCLACTELPLAFEGREHLELFEENGVTYINTTIVHAAAAFRYAVEG